MASDARIAVLSCSFEGNSFSPATTTLADFQACEWQTGAAARDFYRGTAAEMAAVLDFADAHDDCEVRWLRCAAAAPGGALDAVSWQELQRQLLDPLAALQAELPVDGVYLSLHGALACKGQTAPEQTLIESVRELAGPGVALAVSFDLHANLSAGTARQAQIVVGARSTAPVDAYRSGARCMGLLLDAIGGRIRPASVVMPAQAILPSHGMTTDSGAMRELQELADEIARRPGVLDATVFGGCAYVDAPQTGASASVCVDGGRERAQVFAAELAGAIRARRAQFAFSLPQPPEGIAAALEAVDLEGGPVAVLEPSDSPQSGGIGDTPGLFRALLAAQPRCESVFAFFHDPPAVASAFAAGVGAPIALRLGGRLSGAYGAPVDFEGRVARLTDGVFVNDGPAQAGVACSWGRSAVLQSGPIRVAITETCRSPDDLAWCRLHGIDLERIALWCVKAKHPFRATFGRYLKRILEVDSPGPAELDIRKLSYRFAQKAWLPE
jgi:microcystin degradation protein MlrC